MIMNDKLNSVVMFMACKFWPNGYNASSIPPMSFEELKRMYANTGRITVSTDHSDKTIFGDPAFNWAFRAWHDYCHLIEDADFSLQGETTACETQCSQVVESFVSGELDPNLTCADIRQIINLLRAEVIGQAFYKQIHGDFVQDQVAFVMEYIVNPESALLRENI